MHLTALTVSSLMESLCELGGMIASLVSLQIYEQGYLSTGEIYRRLWASSVEQVITPIYSRRQSIKTRIKAGQQLTVRLEFWCCQKEAFYWGYLIRQLNDWICAEAASLSTRLRVICCPGAEGLVLEYLHPETLNISFGFSTNQAVSCQTENHLESLFPVLNSWSQALAVTVSSYQLYPFSILVPLSILNYRSYPFLLCWNPVPSFIGTWVQCWQPYPSR